MDGLFHGKPNFLMDDLGCFPPIFGNTQISLWIGKFVWGQIKYHNFWGETNLSF